MSRLRVYELAKALGVATQDVITRAIEAGIPVEGHLSPLDPDAVALIRKAFSQPREGEVVQKRMGTVIRRSRMGGEEDTVRPPVRRGGRGAAAEPPPPEPIAAAPAPAPAPEPEPVEVAPIAAHVEYVAPAPAPEQPSAVPTPEPFVEAAESPDRLENEAPAPPIPMVAEGEGAVHEAPVFQPPPVPEPPAPVVSIPQSPPEPRRIEELRPRRQQVMPHGREARPAPTAEIRSRLRIDPHGRPTDTQAVVVAGPPPDFQPPRPPPGPGGRGGYGGRPSPMPPMQAQAPMGDRGPAPRPPMPPPPGGPPPLGLAAREAEKKAAGRRRGKRIVEQRGATWNPRTAMDDELGRRRGGRRSAKKGKLIKTALTTPKAAKRVVRMEEVITVADLAQQMSIKANEVIKSLMKMGLMAGLNQALDYDTATLVAEEYGFTVEDTSFALTDYVPDVKSTEEDLEPRPPVVTIMGHVDHGKTSLLDHIRKTKVAEGEAGGITQHIGAYAVESAHGRVIFLDTPGHEAFTAMRARGAQVTDIVILVVAADDGVMPQTMEAIAHAREAGVPIIVAVTKIDKDNARPDYVLHQLAEQGLNPEEWGGETIVVKVSSHTGEGIDQLVEMLGLQSEVLELKANRSAPARGVVIEAQLDKGRGPVATILVKEGTLKVGDHVVCGTESGRVRAMNDFMGRKIKEATPSEPVEILGLSGVPLASEPFFVVEDEKKARAVVEHRESKERQKHLGKTARVSLANLFEQLEAGEMQQLKIILKADVQGTIEALKKALLEIKHPGVEVRIIHDGVGGISESDVNLASASNGIIIGFNVRAEAATKQLADQEDIEIKIYSVIYDVIDDVKKGMEGLLEPTVEERDMGRAEVRDTFSTPKFGVIAGCIVLNGHVKRGALARLYRDGARVWEGRIGSLRRFKNDVREVTEGYECGIGLENYNDIKIGDVIETYEKVEVAQKIQ